MLKQFRQKHRENHKHGYYKPAWTDTYRTIISILHSWSEEIKPSAGKMHFIWVSTYLALKVIGTLFFHLLLEKGLPFYIYIDIQAMCRSGNWQDKGSTCTFISQLFQNPEYWSSPKNWNPRPPWANPIQWWWINPLSLNIHIQILQTDIHTSPLR